jgi:hypothetical protein
MLLHFVWLCCGYGFMNPVKELNPQSNCRPSFSVDLHHVRTNYHLKVDNSSISDFVNPEGQSITHNGVFAKILFTEVSGNETSGMVELTNLVAFPRKASFSFQIPHIAFGGDRSPNHFLLPGKRGFRLSLSENLFLQVLRPNISDVFNFIFGRNEDGKVDEELVFGWDDIPLSSFSQQKFTFRLSISSTFSGSRLKIENVKSTSKEVIISGILHSESPQTNQNLMHLFVSFDSGLELQVFDLQLHHGI